MATLADVSIRNAIDYERYKAGHVKGVMPILNKLSSDIYDLILRMDTSSAKSVNATIRKVNELIDIAFAKIAVLVNKEHREYIATVVEDEEEILPFVGSSYKFTAEELEKASNSVMRSLAIGATFTKHLSVLEAITKRRMTQKIRQGVADRESVNVIASSVRGSRTNRYKDGAFNPTRNNMATILNTAITAYTNNAKQWAYKRAGVDRYIWISVIDGNTTDICIGRNKKVWKVGQGPLPPAHYGCRSTIAPYSKEPFPEDFNQWLSTQSKITITDVLGPKRAKAYLVGDLKIDKFTVFNGRELTLQQLINRGK